MKTYQLVISTPVGNPFSGEVIGLSVRGVEGDLAVLANHVPFITTLKPCQCKITLPDETEKIGQVEGGLLTVGNEKVTLLSDSFAWI